MSYIEPGIALALLLAALGMMPRLRRLCGGRNILTPLALLGLFCWSFPPVALLNSWMLESRYPVRSIPDGDAEAIVVLSGGLAEVRPTQPLTLPEVSTYRRTMYAAWLYRNWRPAPVVTSGGRISRSAEEMPASEVMKEILVSQGLPEEQVWLESDSHSTFENAVFTARLLRTKGIARILLVTDGVHMPRAELTFHRQGLEVVPAPCCYFSTIELDYWYHYLPTRKAIRANEACLHEWAGLLWYWARDRI